LLFLSGEVFMGVPTGTAAVARPLLAVEKSAAAVVPAGIVLRPGRAKRRAEV
jgi:hypothetical protein